MTKKEAIKLIQNLIDQMNEDGYAEIDAFHEDALLMAIKALEQEPCELSSAQQEIIRCGQCKYAEVADPEDSQDGYTCQYHRGSIWFSGSFCSWAERRGEE